MDAASAAADADDVSSTSGAEGDGGDAPAAALWDLLSTEMTWDEALAVVLACAGVLFAWWWWSEERKKKLDAKMLRDWLEEEPDRKRVLERPIDLNRVFDEDELMKYDGSDLQGPIYVACKGRVFDVSHSGFYGTDGPYKTLAGRDASRALARLDYNDLATSMEGVLPHQLQTLDEWEEQYVFKYEVVGTYRNKRPLIPPLEKSPLEGSAEEHDNSAKRALARQPPGRLPVNAKAPLKGAAGDSGYKPGGPSELEGRKVSGGSTAAGSGSGKKQGDGGKGGFDLASHAQAVVVEPSYDWSKCSCCRAAAATLRLRQCRHQFCMGCLDGRKECSVCKASLAQGFSPI